ncbi:MAG TPA: hypothetical protein VMB21_09895 [Candidatus Limnocylindria bacterium]|nr:hypothetical protein [Candidatus Limnocylindria bacterium]
MKAPSLRGHLVALLAGASLTGACAAGSYRLTDLGAGVANDVNNSGHVVGTTAAQQAFFYNGVTNRNIPVVVIPGGDGGSDVLANTSQAFTINDADLLVDNGSSSTAFLSAANRYQAGAGANPYVISPVASPLAINNSGAVVGTVAAGPAHDFMVGIWDTGSGIYTFGFDTFGLGFSRISAINDAGFAVGSAALQIDSDTPPLHPAPGLVRACVFRTNRVEYIDARFPGTTVVDVSQPANHLSDAYGVNAAGHIVGEESLLAGSPVRHAFRYTGSGFEDLGTLGGTTSAAFAINADDLVVGMSTLVTGEAHAFLWQDGVMTDLNTQLPAGSGWVLTRANAINDRGEIAGTGTFNGIVHAFLLSPGDVAPALSILVHPVGTTLPSGQAYTLSVTAQGTDPLTYQWQHEGTNLPGATQSSFVIAKATALDAGHYGVTVHDGTGASTSDGAEIIVLDPILPVRTYLGLTLQDVLGVRFRIEAVETLAETNWVPLTTLTLTSTNQLYIDYDSPNHPDRLYRAIRQP